MSIESYYESEDVVLFNADCIEKLKELPENSVDLIVVDPPYYKIMKQDHKGKKYDWDDQWKSFENYLQWCNIWFIELKRLLKKNGSLYVFTDDKISAYIQVELDKLFHLENNLVWKKPNNMTIKGWRNYRCYAPITERILFYSKESRNNNIENEVYAENVKIFSPLVEYMKEQKRLIKEYFNFNTDVEFNNFINKVTNTKSVVSRHYFTYSQWVFPTNEIYKKLQSINKKIFKKEYEIFKKEYENLRRYFNPEKNFTDVWEFNIIGGKENVNHPTQKPLRLIERIIKTSSKKGDLVLDPFGGSGTTLVASKKLGRKAVGIELNKEYCDIAVKRVKEYEGVKRLDEFIK